MKFTAFCGVIVCSLLEIYKLVDGPVSCIFCPEDGDFFPESKFHVIKEQCWQGGKFHKF